MEENFWMGTITKNWGAHFFRVKWRRSRGKEFLRPKYLLFVGCFCGVA